MILKMQIQKRRLGKTEIEVTPIGLGSWQFSGNIISRSYWKSSEDIKVNDVVKAALDGGINWFDTAELYGFGGSEKALSRALTNAGKTNGDVVIATKWLPALRTASSIVKTIDKRLKCLEPFGVDLYQIHFSNTRSSIEDQMDAMADLLERGTIKAVGVSNFSDKELRKAHKRLAARGFPLASIQMRYNLLDRNLEKDGVLAAALELGVTVISYSPLQLGLLSGRFHQKPELISKLPRLRKNVLAPMLEPSRTLMTALEKIAVTTMLLRRRYRLTG